VDVSKQASDVLVRRAHEGDSATIARHRADMFSDMGQLPAHLRGELEDATRRLLSDALRTGEYVGWLVETTDGTATIVAGGGVLLRARLPGLGATTSGPCVLTGREGIVYNMFTERGWRRRGFARRLMKEILAWAPSSDVSSLVLHASDQGRPLYASLGFVGTSEMRYARPLR
jgi:GNAT superfamily N-acetyltransferase